MSKRPQKASGHKIKTVLTRVSMYFTILFPNYSEGEIREIIRKRLMVAIM